MAKAIMITCEIPLSTGATKKLSRLAGGDAEKFKKLVQVAVRDFLVAHQDLATAAKKPTAKKGAKKSARRRA